MTDIVNELLRRFRTKFTGAPPWAWPFKPPIPLVGHQCTAGEGLMIYASAENLSWLNNKPSPDRFTSEDAWNRYRVVYEEAGRNSGSFFPDVGIQPMTDGGLFAAGWFICNRLGLPTHAQPRAFLETIAVSNWCKFSIHSKTNQDYVGDRERLEWSLPYVVEELAALRPAVVLLPHSIWRRGTLAAAMTGASPATRFLPMPQFNVTVVNCHLRDHDASVDAVRQQTATRPLAEWMTHLHGFRERNAWRYIAMLSARMQEQARPR